MFHNIFSDKQEKPENKNPIVIDNREKNSLVIANLMERKANIKLEQLEIADYIVGDIAIERKTFSDFISSMINKRLISQLEGIKKYPRYFLIIEGKCSCESPSLNKSSRGMILSIITSFQIPIIFSQNEEETAEILIILAKQLEKPKQLQSLRYSPSNLTEEEQKQFILEGFPGIGPVTAKKLLEKFKSIKNIINAPETELKEILGKKYDSFSHFLI